MKNQNEKNTHICDKLNFEVQQFHHLPVVSNKLSFISTYKFISKQLEKDKSKIIEQIYLINMFYKTINRQKQNFDCYYKKTLLMLKFFESSNIKHCKQSMNSQVNKIFYDLNTYTKYELNVRKNVNTYLKNRKVYYNYLVKGVYKFNFNNSTLSSLESELSNDFEFNNVNIANSYYCKKDIINKIQYINKLSGNFISFDNLKTINTLPSTQTKILNKGEISL